METNNLSEKFLEKLFLEDIKDRIVITPIISEKQINDGIVDLRLGTEFILTRKTEFSSLDITEEDLQSNIKKYQEKIVINSEEGLILHPNQFILGSTLEYIKLPDDVMGYIIGRSSWGRLGLVIATATLINPGFAGVITLELTNVGEVPIKLFPSLRIAQISFHKCNYKMEEKTEKKFRKYFGSTSPSFSEVYKDYDNILVEKEKEDIKFLKKLILSLNITIQNDPNVDIRIVYKEIEEKVQKIKSHFNSELLDNISNIENHIRSLDKKTEDN